MGPIVGGVLFDMTGSYLLAFLFAGTLCFVAAGNGRGVGHGAEEQTRAASCTVIRGNLPAWVWVINASNGAGGGIVAGALCG